jgi:CheY-like chemotaxis protein
MRRCRDLRAFDNFISCVAILAAIVRSFGMNKSADWSLLNSFAMFSSNIIRFSQISFRRGSRPMLGHQIELSDTSVSPESAIQKTPNSMVAGDTAAPSYESPLTAEAKAVAQFRFRILVVDDEPSIREAARMILESEDYEVLTAADGVEALHSLSRSLPDLIISDLNMPRMSGFEFLAVVRERFPNIATIAMSGGYGTGEIPLGILADAFLQKGNCTIQDLPHQVGKLLAASPLRSARMKSEIAPLFVPRNSAGYLVITCPKCLRPNKLQAMSLNGGLHQTTCHSCGTPVSFEIDHEIEPLLKRKHA